MMLIGSLALMGFPFLTGFYSKDVILELAYARYDFIGHYAYFLGVAAAFCTAFYSIRLLYLVFLSPTNGNRIIILNAHENSFEIITPLVFLCFFSINIGYLSKDFFIGFGTDFWGSSLFVLPTNHVLIDSEFIPTTYKLLPLIVTILGSLFAYMLYVYGLRMFLYFKKNRFFYKFICGLNRKWFFDRIYTEFITQNILKKAYFFSYQVIDRGLLEYSGPSSFVYYFKNLSKASVKAQTGLFWHYFIYFIGGVLLLLILFF